MWNSFTFISVEGSRVFSGPEQNFNVNFSVWVHVPISSHSLLQWIFLGSSALQVDSSPAELPGNGNLMAPFMNDVDFSLGTA